MEQILIETRIKVAQTNKEEKLFIPQMKKICGDFLISTSIREYPPVGQWCNISQHREGEFNLISDLSDTKPRYYSLDESKLIIDNYTKWVEMENAYRKMQKNRTDLEKSYKISHIKYP